MEHETISPCNDGASKSTLRDTIAGNKEGRARWKEPYEDKVKDGSIIAEVE